MKKNRKNKTKSILACAVLAGVLGSGFGMGMSMAEAAQMPVFGLWNEGMKNNYAHWAFPQTVISPTQLTGGQTLNLSAGYYVLSDEWDYVDSLVGSTLNILDGAYLNGRNNIIKGLNLNLSGNACAENIDSFEYGNLTMADNSKLYVGGRVGMTAGLPATATINGGEMSCSEETQSIDGFIVNGTVHVRDEIRSMSIKVGPEGKLYLGNFAGRDGSTDILNEGTVYGGEVFLKTLEHDDEPLPFYVHGGKVVLQPDLVLEGEDYQRVSEHFTYGSDSQDVRIFADDVKLGMDVALEEDSTSSLGFKLKFSDPIALGTEESILSYPLQAGSTLVVQPNIPNFDFDTFFKSFFNDGDELSGVAQVVDNRNDSLYTLKCPETYVFGRGVNRKGLSIELELGDAEISLGGVYSNQKVDVKVIRLEPFSTEWFDYQRHVLEKRDYGGGLCPVPNR